MYCVITSSHHELISLVKIGFQPPRTHIFMSMEISSLEELIQHIEEDATGEERLLVVVYGGPGSGKTTVSGDLVDKLNQIYYNDLPKLDPSPKCIQSIDGGLNEANSIYIYEAENISCPFATHIKMDGFHFPITDLSPEQIKRRGSPSTFDAEQVVELFRLLLRTDWDLLSLPDFDHTTKDPINKSVWLYKNTHVMVLEGLYLMLEDPPWDQIAQMIQNNTSNVKIKVVKINGGDDTKFRVAQRHLKSGIVQSLDEGLKKYYDNDYINLKLVKEKSNDICDYIFDNSRDI